MAAGFSKLMAARELLKPSFEGRITFEEYARAGLWLSVLWIIFAIVILVFCAIAGISAKSSEHAGIGAIIVFCLFGIGGAILLTISHFSLMARRLHDVGYSGNYLWLYLVCCIGGFVPQVLCLGDTDADNAWGPGDNNHSGSKFSDLNRSFKYLLHPDSRLTLKEFGIVATIFGWITSFIMEIPSNLIDGVSTLSEFSEDDAATLASLGVVFVVMGIFTIIMGIIYLRIAIPRLHDTGRSGANFLWILACGVGGLIPMIMCYADSDDDNEYGPNRNNNNDSDSNDSNDPYSFYASNHSSNDECVE